MYKLKIKKRIQIKKLQFYKWKFFQNLKTEVKF